MERANLVTAECFNAIAQIRALGDDAHLSPEQFHARMIAFIDAFYVRARQAGVADGDMKEMAYAIAALADEVALRKHGVREVWMSRPMQYHFFGDNMAGERFFQRLEYHIADPTKQEVLRVYYLCLMFGFSGQYAQRGRELELSAVIRRVQDALGPALRNEALSVRHQRPRERIGRRRAGLLTIWIGLFAILFSVALIAVLRWELDRRADKLDSRVRAMLGE